jgi:hypothetical protein
VLGVHISSHLQTELSVGLSQAPPASDLCEPLAELPVLSPPEPDPGTSRLLRLPHEALRGWQGPRTPYCLRLCRIYPLALCELILSS